MDRNELAETFRSVAGALESLVAIQAEYDAVGWRVSEPKTAKFRHICLHLMRTTAEFARVAEHNDHAEDEGKPLSNDELRSVLDQHGLLLAELLFSVLQIAELGQIDLSAALNDLYRRNARHFAPTSAFSELEALRYDEELKR